MDDFLELVTTATNPQFHGNLNSCVATLVKEILASADKERRDQVANAELAVRRSPESCFTFDSTHNAVLTVNEQSWNAGRFESVSIGELKLAAKSKSHRTTGANELRQSACNDQRSTARSRLWLLDGASPATDIGALQANCPETLFQVASQFNCLESPGPYVTAVMNYFADLTQGPRASISAYPATLLRHYYAPSDDGTRFEQQTNGRQIDLLKDVCPGMVRNGYFTGKGIADPEPAVSALESKFDCIRVGLHDNVEVVLGYNWNGSVLNAKNKRITQVFTSTVAGGGYDGRINLGEHAFTRASRQLLRAAYLGTILSAVVTGRKRVLLTLIGGGVFQNPVSLILEAIEWALDEAEPYLSNDLDVILNGYNIARLLNLSELAPRIRERGGAILRFDSFTGLTAILN